MSCQSGTLIVRSELIARLERPVIRGRQSPAGKEPNRTWHWNDSRRCRSRSSCRTPLNTPGGPYAEGAHIRPLGSPHLGSDTPDNVLCLCPNHHTMFDNFGFTLADDLQLIGISRLLSVHDDHNISVENVRYHREHRYKNPLAK